MGGALAVLGLCDVSVVTRGGDSCGSYGRVGMRVPVCLVPGLRGLLGWREVAASSACPQLPSPSPQMASLLHRLSPANWPTALPPCCRLQRDLR